MLRGAHGKQTLEMPDFEFLHDTRMAGSPKASELKQVAFYADAFSMPFFTSLHSRGAAPNLRQRRRRVKSRLV